MPMNAASWTRARGVGGVRVRTEAPVKIRKRTEAATAAARAELAPLRKKSKEAEKQINDLSRKIADIEARLADPDLYASGGEDLASLQETLGGTKKEQADLEYSWLEIQENLENLTSNQ